MIHKLAGQPASYEKKYERPIVALPNFSPMIPMCSSPDTRTHYHFGRTLGAGTYGIVREAESDSGKVAVKIILKKNVRGNEQMVYDELDMLQKLDHPHIVHFVDWFESKVSFPSFLLWLMSGLMMMFSFFSFFFF